MTRLDERTFSPADFEASFAGEPAPVPAYADLARGRRSRRRRQVLYTAAAASVTAFAVAVLGGALPGRSVEVGPVRPGQSTAVPSVPPTPRPTQRTPTPTPAPTPDRDTAPPLRHTKQDGYVDATGQAFEGPGDRDFSPRFQATTRSTYTLVRSYLDPTRAHLGPYEPEAFTGGGGVDVLEVGQKLGWTVEGQRGQGMLQVAVTRMGPGRKARLTGPDGVGLCAGLRPEIDCRKRTFDGIQVWYASTGDGGFVMDVVQEDGEVASLLKNPVFGNNTDIALESMEVRPAQVAQLLADRRLDVVG